MRWTVPSSWSLGRRLKHYSRRQGRCRIWTASCGPGGYGKLCWKGKYHRAHRLAWRAWRGPIPRGLNVLHHCDTPACIEPSHLFVGTHADNVADKMRKGRHPRNGSKGSLHPNAVLTEETAMAVFRAQGRQVDIARQYGIQQAAVSKIKRKATWPHIHRSVT